MSYFKNFSKVQYDVFGDGKKRLMTNLATYATIKGRLLDDVSYYSNYTIQDGYRPDNVSVDLYGIPDYYWTFFVVNPKLKNAFADWPKSTGDLREYVEDSYPNLAAMARDPYGRDNFAGKFVVGEIVTGQITNAIGRVLAIYPSIGYMVIEPITGTFREAGEALLGTGGDSVVTNAIIKEAYAPAYYIDAATGFRTDQRTAGVVPVTHYDVEYKKNEDNSFIRVIKPEFIGDVAKEFKQAMRS